MYPASANLGTLISVECKPGTMLISRAVSRRSCLRFIRLVALLVRLSENINVLVDLMPVLSKQSSSSSGAVLDMAPVSRIPVLRSVLLWIFRAQCAATLLAGPLTVVAVMAKSTLVVLLSSLSKFSSCSSTRQATSQKPKMDL